MNDAEVAKERLKALRALKRKARGGEVATGDLAKAYRVTDARFTNLKKRVMGFPAPKQRGKVHFYPADKAIDALIEHTQKSQSAKRAHGQAINSAVNGNHAKAAGDAVLGAREILALTRAKSEMFKLEQEMKKYVLVSDAEDIMTNVLTIVSRSVSNLRAKIDPNGRLPPWAHVMIDDAGNEILTKAYEEMKGLLPADVQVAAKRPPRPATKAKRARNAKQLRSRK